MTNTTAFLGNESNFTTFSFNGIVLRFAAPYSLEYYTKVILWDKGYLVVMAKYQHNEKPEEEYIDLVPVLKDLYFDPDSFLEPIKEVVIKND